MSKRTALILKLLGAAAVLGVIALAVGGFALKKYLPPEKVRQLVVENARKYLNRELRLTAIDLSVLSGLTITGLEVSEKPDFKAGRFAAAEKFSMRVQIMPLLAKKVVVDKVALENFKVEVRKGKDGRFNFSDLTQSSAAAPSSPGRASAPELLLDLAVRQLILTGAGLSYKDLASGNEVIVGDLNAAVFDFAMRGSFDADVAMNVSGRWDKKPLKARLEYKGSVDLADMNFDKLSTSIMRSRLELPEGSLEASGSIRGINAPVVEIKASWQGRGAEPIALEASGALAEITSEAPEANLAVKAKTPMLRSEDFPAAAGVPKGLLLPPAEISSEFHLKGDGIDLKNLSLTATGAKITAQGKIARLRDSPPEPDLSLSARLDVPALKSSDLIALKALQIAVPENLNFPSFKAEADFHIKGEDLSLKELNLKTAGVDLSAKGALRRLRAQRPEPDLSLTARLNIPALKSSDLGVLKTFSIPVPESMQIPAFEAEADLQFKGDGMTAKAFKIKGAGFAAEASGVLREMYSKKPQHDLELSVKLDLPELKSGDMGLLGAFKITVPAGIELPPSSLAARARLEGDSLTLRELRFKIAHAVVEGAGSVKKLWSGRPDADVNIKAALDLPALTAKDLAVLKLASVSVPDNLTLPASKIGLEAHFKGEDLRLKTLNLKASGVSVAASGSVKNVIKKPVPELSAKIDLDLPAFTSEDIAFIPGIPADLKIPASKLEAEISGGLDAVDIKFLRLVTGQNNLALKGRIVNFGKGGTPAYDLTMMCKSFDLAEITQISAKTRELNLAGKGSFRLKVAQKPPEKPYYLGDLNFTGLGATIAGIKFSDFAVSGSYDEKKIDFPKIAGKVDGGKLEMDMTVRNYAKTPSIDVQSIVLDEFDLGKYLAAKGALGSASSPGEASAKTPPFNFKCREFKIGRVKHPNFSAFDARFQWDLTGITPDFKSLDGEAKINVSSGTLEQINKLALQYPMAKVVIIPLLVIQNVAGLGIIKLLPDLKHVVFSRIDGDYSFSSGKMTLKRSVLDSRAALIQATGTIDLPSEALDLDVNAKVGHYPGINMTVRGSINAPEAKLGYRKVVSEILKGPLEEPLKKALGEPGKELLDKVFKRQ